MDLPSIYAFTQTVLVNCGAFGAVMAQSVGFRCQVSGFGRQEKEVLNADTRNLTPLKNKFAR
jgi:hypothetical protein